MVKVLLRNNEYSAQGLQKNYQTQIKINPSGRNFKQREGERARSKENARLMTLIEKAKPSYG